MKKSRLIIACITVLMVALCMTACGSQSASSSDAGSTKTAESTVIKTESEKADTAKEKKTEKKSDKKEKSDKKTKEKTAKKEASKEKTATKSSSKTKDASKSKSKDKSKSKSKDKSKDKSKPKPKPETAKYCSISITCHVLNKGDVEVPENLKKYVPSSGVILGKRKIKIEKGDTVMDISIRATKAAGIPFAYQGHSTFGTAYIEGINNIFEMDITPKSGWLYLVNGSTPGKGCSGVKVSAGDSIEWRYTLDVGEVY